MIYATIIAIMTILARMAGGGFGADRFKLAMIPEVLFGACFGVAYYMAFDSLILSTIVTVWSYLWMETGHGTVLHWGANPSAATGERRQRLTPVVEWLSDRLGLRYGGIGYCRLFMALKGFLIGLPVGGIPLAILWPLAYETKLYHKNHAITEMLSGAFAGISICLFLMVFR